MDGMGTKERFTNRKMKYFNAGNFTVLLAILLLLYALINFH